MCHIYVCVCVIFVPPAIVCYIIDLMSEFYGRKSFHYLYTAT